MAERAAAQFLEPRDGCACGCVAVCVDAERSCGSDLLRRRRAAILRGGANMDSAGGGRPPPRKFKVKGAPLRPPAHAQTSLCDGLRELELGSAKMMEPTTLLTDLPPDMVQHIVVRLTLAHHMARAAPSCKVEPRAS